VTPVTRLQREEAVERDGWTETAVLIEHPWEERARLWYRVQLPEGWKLSPSSDPLLLVPLYKAMRAGGRLEVEGDVSPSLLANLEEFQALMACWHRGRFRQVEIVPEREVEQPPGDVGALVAFSGGVDGCFTALRHASGSAGRQTQKLRAGLMLHGFDFPVAEPQGFGVAADNAEAMLATLGVPLVRVASNVQRVEHAWNDVVGAVLASCFHLLQPNARAALIGAEFPYHLLVGPGWSSHPLADPLLSSSALRVIHDGAGFTRPEKIRAISDWPAAMEHLLVCWEGPRTGFNCSRCSKCVRTILAFRALGLPLPGCFRDVSDADIRAIGPLGPMQRNVQRQLLDVIDERNLTGSWVRATRSIYYRGMLYDHFRRVKGQVRRRAGAALPGRA
jgi:hypothetical protein